MKIYRAVGNRVAVDFSVFSLPIAVREALGILRRKSIVPVTVDLLGLAKMQIGKRYKRGSRMVEAPEVFDCSSLIKWLYGQSGIWLPRRSIQQIECGSSTPLSQVENLDIVFTSGYCNYYTDDPTQGVGHVGIVSDSIGTHSVIHAANKKAGVVETPLSKFVQGKSTETILRGVRRILPKSSEFFVLEFPPDREIETSDDIRWIIYQNM